MSSTNYNSSDETESPARREAPSKTPTWLFLGFVFGALFVWALPRRDPPPLPLVLQPAPPAREPATPARFTTIENVFAVWGHDAVWDNDLTEVGLFNSDTGRFSDRYEVLRSGDNYYFRTLSQFTRPVLTHGIKAGSPLQFTEPQAKRDEWLHERNQLTYRALTGAGPPETPPPAAAPEQPRP